MTASGGPRLLPTSQPNLALHRPTSDHVSSRSPATIQFPLLSCSSLAALDLLFLSRPFLSPPWPLGTVVYRPPWTHRSHLSSPCFLVVCNSLHIFQQCLQSAVVSSTRDPQHPQWLPAASKAIRTEIPFTSHGVCFLMPFITEPFTPTPKASKPLAGANHTSGLEGDLVRCNLHAALAEQWARHPSRRRVAVTCLPSRASRICFESLSISSSWTLRPDILLVSPWS